MNENEVIWCYSLIDNDVIFIFRDRGKEIRIDLKDSNNKIVKTMNWLRPEETELIVKLKAEVI
jgi:hypothetical protein